MAEVVKHDPAALMEDLRGFVMDEGREVTYKFLCSSLSISSDLAKRLLFQFVSESEGKVRATFAVSGWNKPTEGSRARKVVVVKEDQVKETVESMSEVLSAHVFSVQKGPSTPSSGTALWATEHIDKEEMYKASPEVGNSLRDNRHAHIKFSKVVRNLKPRRGAAAAEQIPPQSSDKAKANAFATPGKSAADASASSSNNASKAQTAPSGPKLSAAEMRMKELASGSSSNKAAAPKLSAAELRMKELMSGGTGGGSRGKQQQLFAGKGSSSSKSKKSAFAKPEPKKEEEEEEDDEPAKVEAKPQLGFSFDFEKEKAPPKKADAGKKDKKDSKSKGLSEKEKKKADEQFICDASEESANEEEEEEEVEEKGKNKDVRKRRRQMLDESDEEEAAPPTPVRSKNQYKMALAESESEEEAGGKEEKAKSKAEAEEAEDSGDESDSSHSRCQLRSLPARAPYAVPGSDTARPPTSQHTNASDPGVQSTGRPAQGKAGAAGGDEEVDDLADMPNGKLVITKKGSGAKVVGGEEEGGGKKKKARARKEKEEGEEEGEAKPKCRRKKSDDDDDGDEAPKKKASRKKAVDLDLNQKTLDVSAYKVSPVKDTGPSKRRKKVERCYEDEKGFLVTEEAWVTDEEAGGDDAKMEDAGASAEHKPDKTAALKAAPEKSKPVEKKKSVAKANTNQSGIMSFFSKKQ